MEKYKILIVDDEEDICEILQYNLIKAGYEVDFALSAEEALPKLIKRYHLLLLDIMMAGMSGATMARPLREEYKVTTPIIFVTALDEEKDVLKGFDIGADDYIAKPFSVKEVVARVTAVINRTYARKGIAGAPEVEGLYDGLPEIKVNELAINPHTKRVFIGSNEVVLTKKECEILLLLAVNMDKIFSREDILRKIWRDEGYVVERTVDVHIARLRKKLGEYSDCIVNRSGYGYSFHKRTE